DPRIHADGVLGTRFHAVAAEDAFPEVDVEPLRHLLDLGVRMLVGHDVDAARRAHGLAHHAGHAPRRAVLATDEPVQRAQPRGIRPPLLRILDGDGAVRVLPAEAVRDVLAHVAEEVPRGQPEAAQHLAQVEALPEVHRLPHASSTAPVRTMLRIESGKRPSQPSRIAWSYRTRGS